MKSRLLLALFCLSSLFLVSVSQTASACPMCNEANASPDEKSAENGTPEVNNRPRAYMYSIIFMMLAPPTLLGGFSLVFYRAIRKHQRLIEATGQDNPANQLPE